MSLFSSEASMQEWLENQLAESECLSELLTSCVEEWPTGQTLAERRILETYAYCTESFGIVEVFSQNEDFALGAKEALKPDMLLFAPETQSMVVVELKNIAGPTRQAATELSAYCSEINNYLPFISDGDVINVIVSTEWPTLLRKHALQDILWRGRKLICLKPIDVSGEIRLQPVLPDELGCTHLDQKFAPHHIGGYQLCLYDHSLYEANNRRDRLDNYLPQMKSAMRALEATGNSLKNHGFAFLWKDNWKESLAPYNMSIMNVASFNRLDRFLLDGERDAPISEIQMRFFNLAREHSPDGHGQSLIAITEEAERFLSPFCSPKPEGFATWPVHRDALRRRAELVSFAAWGYFGDMRLSELQQKYASGTQADFDDPIVGLQLVDRLVDENVPSIDLSHVYFGDEEECE